MKGRFVFFKLFFVVVFIAGATPAQAFWPKNVCQRLMASIYAVPQKIKNFKINWFGTKSESRIFGQKSSFFFKPFSFFNVSTFASHRKEECSTGTCDKSKEEKSKIKKFDGNKVLILACNTLCHLDIHAEDPIKQIQALNTEQQFKAFTYIMHTFQNPQDKTMLPDIYEVMKHLEAPKKEYSDFYQLIGENTGNCCRSAISWGLIKMHYLTPSWWGGKLPPEISEKFNNITKEDAWAYYNYTKELPEWLRVMKEKMPCDNPDMHNQEKAAA